jgi:hypothetical protein
MKGTTGSLATAYVVFELAFGSKVEVEFVLFGSTTVGKFVS